MLTMEWVTGVKLTGLPAAEVRALVAVGQEAFLTQLLEVGFFHGGKRLLDCLFVCFLGVVVGGRRPSSRSCWR